MGKNNLHALKNNITETLKKSYYIIEHNYRYFKKISKNNNDILNAAEWLLDNFYIIEKTYKNIKLTITKSFLERIPYDISNNKITVRILNISRNYINCGNKIELDSICKYINDIQKIKNNFNEYEEKNILNIGELNSFPIMLKISLLINFALYSKELVLMQEQINRGKKDAEFFVDNFHTLYRKNKEYMQDSHENELYLRAFFNVLKNNSINYSDEQKYIDKYLNVNVKLFDINKKAQLKERIFSEKMKEYFFNLRSVDDIQWDEFFSRTSLVEMILMKDPSEVYPSMDLPSKKYYRFKIEEMSSTINMSEVKFAENILENALKAKIYKEEEYKTHVGYYIIDEGINKVNGCYHNLNDVISPGVFISIILFLTSLFIALILKTGMIIGSVFTIKQLIVSVIVLLAPANECAVAIVNWIVSKTVRIRFIPKLDFTKGIPEKYKTIVVIPTITNDPDKIKRLMKKLEVLSEGNKDKNIYFALLADLCDSENEEEDYDKEIIASGLKCAHELNKKYLQEEKNAKFYFLSRPRLYNNKEHIYMCHERKRGKLMEFMALLRDKNNYSFNVISNDITPLRNAVYLITLDDDTFMPRETVCKLTGAMSHILNIPYVKNNKVIRGYGIMQPKIGITLEAKNKTWFSKIFASESIIDGYSCTYSDTYQDLFGEGSFTGKGIINIDEFYKRVECNIKENRILSHDLLEGGLARSALVTDIEFLDGYPSTYMASCERLHRWSRGDWQLIGWLFSKKISMLYKWKIIDNLKRTLVAPSMLAALILALTYLRNNRIILLSLFVCAMPLIFRITDFVVTPKSKLHGTFKNFEQLFIIAAFIPYQSFLMFDAIIRTLYRLCISRRYLLQWKSSDNIESFYKNSFKSYIKKMWISPVAGIFILYLSFFNNPIVFVYNLLFAALWICAPYIAYYISKEIVHKEESMTLQDKEYLRDISRRIFAYYEDFIIEENNYLPPDNYQEDPYKGIARRTSPTNIAMGITAQEAGYDFGYLTLFEMLDKIDIILSNMKELQKVHGHYLNWYDITNKEPLYPRYVSTVDNGNLIASLLQIKQCLYDIRNNPLIRKEEVTALEDIYRIIKEENDDIEFRFNKNIEINEYRNILTKIKTEGEKFIHTKEGNNEEILYWTKKMCNECERKIHYYDCIFEGIIDDNYLKKQVPSISDLIFLIENKIKNESEVKENILNEKLIYVKSYNCKIIELIKEVDKIINEMDFKFLYDNNKKLFYTGYNVDENSFGNTHYDFLASEARMTSFVSIAKNDISSEHWFKLNRSMTNAYNGRALVSWSGTMFEYFMPSLLMRDYKHTLLHETYKGVIHAQRVYARQKKIPFGISESAFYEFDVNDNYQYKAFGIPGLGLKRGLEDEVVVSPYSTLMILPFAIKKGIKNLKNLEKYNCRGRYGFIESIDFSKARKDKVIHRNTYDEERKNCIFYEGYVQVCEHNVDKVCISVDKSVNNVHKIVKNNNKTIKKSHVHCVDIVDNFKKRKNNSRNSADDNRSKLLQKIKFIDKDVDKFVDKINKSYEVNDDSIFNDKIKPHNIKTYMVHHLGMSLMALDNVINNKILINRFHELPEVSATELLLKENMPLNITYEHNENYYIKNNYIDNIIVNPRMYNKPFYRNPKILLMSNGTYSSMITTSGTGYSKKDDILLYRYSTNPVNNSSGLFFYIKDVNSNDYWSATYEPCRKTGEEYKVSFGLNKAEFQRKDGNIITKMENVICAEDNFEVRKITIKNTDTKLRNIEVTSYSEVILTQFTADAVHPAFSNLFVETEYDESEQMIIASRRPRTKNAKVLYMFQKAVSNKDSLNILTYETSRINFIGRNRTLKNPKAMDNHEILNNTCGTVLDPIISLRINISIKPDEEKEIYFVTGYSESKENIYNIAKEKCSIMQLNKIFDEYSIYITAELQELNIRNSIANLYQNMASRILFVSDERKETEEYIKNISMHQKDLWAYGISGDFPIILAVIKDEKDIYMLNSVIKFHYYLRLKKVKCDLVIYNEESESYEQPLQKNIYAEISVNNQNNMLNVSGGIFVHNKATMNENVREFIKGICRMYIQCDKGSLLKFFEEKDSNELIHYDYSEINNNKFIEDNYNEKNQNYSCELSDLKLDYFNGYGGFDKKDNSYVIILKDNKNTPAPWINVISNKNFGFHVSESGSSYTWCGNSRENKITPWSNDYIKDPAAEALYVRDNNTGRFFSICPKPVRDNKEYIIRHRFGSSEFINTSYDIKSELKMFVPLNDNLKIQIVTLENLSNDDKEISLLYYAKLVLGVYDDSNSQYISTYIENNYISAVNPYSEFFGHMHAYLSIIGGESRTFTGDNKEFIGIKGDISYPEAIRKRKLSNKCGSIYDPCLSCESSFILKAHELKKLVILFGEENKEKINNIINNYSLEKAEEELVKVNEYWENFLGNIQVSTPDSSMDYMLNGWLLYQTLSCRYLSRSAFYQSGGAYGFRDQLQDSMALGFIEPEIMKNQILISASRQYKEGDVQHWWHPVINSGIRTRFSDDLLWMPYVTAYYINITGDYSILDEKAPYLDDEPLKDGEDERYTIVNSHTEEAEIYEHCLKAIEKSLRFGIHNIPLMGSGDWNDGMSTVGNQGKGESVWLGYFIYSILNDFLKIAEYKHDFKTLKYFKEKMIFIQENIEKNAWDGSWYRRAFFDNGTPLGSKDNPECRIDSLAQSWAVISEITKNNGKYNNRAKEAMRAVEQNLVKKDKKMILLLTPPFDNSCLQPGYIKGYVPGVRENGGQYTHAAVWVILALTKMKENDKAYEYFSMINPINHCKNEQQCMTYKAEPYVMAADVYIKEPHSGRGGWSWYTGAAGWMYRVGIENILGLHKIEGKGYKIIPCVPSSWKNYTITIKNETEEYTIDVIRGDNNYIKINGILIESDIIPRNKGKLNIKVYYC